MMKFLVLVTLLITSTSSAAPSVIGTVRKICYSDLGGECVVGHFNGYIDNIDRLYVPESFVSSIPKMNSATLSAGLRVEKWSQRVDTLLSRASTQAEVRNAADDANAVADGALGEAAMMGPGCLAAALQCAEGGALIPETFGLSVLITWAKCSAAGTCAATMASRLHTYLEARKKAKQEQREQNEKQGSTTGGGGESSPDRHPVPPAGPNEGFGRPVEVTPERHPEVKICDPVCH